jgi:hypothetical protein
VAEDAPLSAEARRSMMRIMAASRVADLKADAAELSALYAELSTFDRERLVALMLGPGED